MKTSSKITLIATAVTAIASQVYGIVDFESVGPMIGDDNFLPTSQTFVDGTVEFQFGVDSDGLTGGLAANSSTTLEEVGNNGGNGFSRDIAPRRIDTESLSFDPLIHGPDLGSYFLRTEPVGTNTNILNGEGVFLITYTGGTAFAASGQIWDIDGNTTDVGTERYIVTAYDSSLNALDSESSPLGDTLALDALPWTFNLFTGTTPIAFITIDFVETDPNAKTSNIGLAFDNFSATSAVPEASTYALLVGMVALAGVMVRRRK